MSKRNLKFIEAFDVNDGIEKIKSVNYKCIYVIISGSLFNDFVNLLKQNLKLISCMPIITMFVMDKAKYEKNEYAYHPFFDPGGIHIYYEDIIDTLIKFDSIVKQKIETNSITVIFCNFLH